MSGDTSLHFPSHPRQRNGINHFGSLEVPARLICPDTLPPGPCDGRDRRCGVPRHLAGSKSPNCLGKPASIRLLTSRYSVHRCLKDWVCRRLNVSKPNCGCKECIPHGVWMMGYRIIRYLALVQAETADWLIVDSFSVRRYLQRAV